jgi:serine/threonine protein kinase
VEVAVKRFRYSTGEKHSFHKSTQAAMGELSCSLCFIGASRITQLLDAFCFSDRGFLVFELWGENLRYLLHEQICKPTDCKVLVKQCLEALQQLQRHRIMHFDIKPANILIKGTGPQLTKDNAGSQPSKEQQKLLKLADLGVSHTPETLQQHTFTHLALQTWPYRAPEVLLQGKNCGFAADMWSVACVMFEIASKGKSLFPFSKSNSKEEDKNGLHDILLLRPEHSRSLTVIWDLFGIMISTPSAWPSNF